MLQDIVRRLSNGSLRAFATFCLIGVLNTAADLAILYCLAEAGLNVYLAATASFAVATVCGYLLNGRFTFGQSGGRSLEQYGRFLGVAVAGLMLTLILMRALVELLGLHYLLAKTATVAVVAFWNYAASAKLVFRRVAEEKP